MASDIAINLAVSLFVFLLVGVATEFIYRYLLHEHKSEHSPGTNTHDGPPVYQSREEFLQHGLEDLAGGAGPEALSGSGQRGGQRHLTQGRQSIPGNCFYCYNKFVGPVRTPCNHILCRACLLKWIDNNNRRCPQCSQVLFTPKQRIEKQVKRSAAMIVASCPLTMLNWFSISGTLLWLIQHTIGTMAVIIGIRIIWHCRKHHGPDWWERFLIICTWKQNVNLIDTVPMIVWPGMWWIYQTLLLRAWLHRQLVS